MKRMVPFLEFVLLFLLPETTTVKAQQPAFSNVCLHGHMWPGTYPEGLWPYKDFYFVSYVNNGLDTNFNNAPSNRYIVYGEVANNDGLWTKQTMTITGIASWWPIGWLYSVYALALVIGLATLVNYRIRKLHEELEQRKKEKLVAQLQQKTTAFQMQALRAQMNPHFIFNALTSINRFILQSDKEQASHYLTKFAKLVRLVLQHSQASAITLESELEALQLYIQLERLRFDNQFSYKISVAPDLDLSAIKIPPLLIQPYAENAIWHGLMHKNEKGRLLIELFREGTVLCCKLTDNGIGRKKAASTKNNVPRHHASGMYITASRITMLQKEMAPDTGIKITDLVGVNGEPAGTKVLFKIPLVYD